MAEVIAVMSLVEDAVSAAMARVLSPELSERDPLVRASEHADFQSNVAMSLAKQVGVPPRELAQVLERELVGGPVGASLSGPGFLNLTVADERLWGQVEARLADHRLGVGTPMSASRTVVDYSALSIAKEMHVGHLRTTVIGDALVRVLDFLGAEVVRQNHLGDWGTQFGMLIQYLDEHPEAGWRAGPAGAEVSAAEASKWISVLDELYRAARREFERDAGFAERARLRVVALQSGDEATLARWRELVAVSVQAFQRIYHRLGVLLTEQDAAGESTYNPFLDEVVEELVEAGIAVESDGALCVFFDDVTGPDGAPVPLIVRKKDGGYGYPATDLAALRHRIRRLGADRILYVVDARQTLHFKMVFATARRAGWLTDRVEAVHVPFGTVLGPGGTPFKTRSGETVRLAGLLDAAVDGVREVMADKPHDLTGEALEAVIQAAGIGAVKYAELSTSRVKNYVFDVAQMVSLHGDTGVYLQYAHARLRTILSRAPREALESAIDPSVPPHPAERALILLLDGFDATVREVARELEPHRLCGYLFALAKALTDFYGSCPVLKAETPAHRANRLALCRLTAETLARGLDLLGIRAPERM
ncbi:arginine--tRNA ligase [Kitasatospora sp. NPDC052896]|uniref:arginine--tRNA ligase n=1 Tax=Kitasatospora sp. NPDC052896 TaxID=3364061 RepID=UPI0037C9EBDC